MKGLLLAMAIATVGWATAGEATSSSAPVATWEAKEAFYAERTQPKSFFGPRHFFFFEIPDWPEWLSWSRFL